MSFRTDDESELLREFIEWLHGHQWLSDTYNKDASDESKRYWLVEDFMKQREAKHANGFLQMTTEEGRRK